MNWFIIFSISSVLAAFWLIRKLKKERVKAFEEKYIVLDYEKKEAK